MTESRRCDSSVSTGAFAYCSLFRVYASSEYGKARYRLEARCDFLDGHPIVVILDGCTLIGACFLPVMSSEMRRF
jgi:hypothetical protein